MSNVHTKYYQLESNFHHIKMEFILIDLNIVAIKIYIQYTYYFVFHLFESNSIKIPSNLNNTQTKQEE